MQALGKPRAIPGLELATVPPAHPPGAGEVSLRVRSAGTCGTDLHIGAWTRGRQPTRVLFDLAGSAHE